MTTAKLMMNPQQNLKLMRIADLNQMFQLKTNLTLLLSQKPTEKLMMNPNQNLKLVRIADLILMFQLKTNLTLLLSQKMPWL